MEPKLELKIEKNECRKLLQEYNSLLIDSMKFDIENCMKGIEDKDLEAIKLHKKDIENVLFELKEKQPKEPFDFNKGVWK